MPVLQTCFTQNGPKLNSSRYIVCLSGLQCPPLYIEMAQNYVHPQFMPVFDVFLVQKCHKTVCPWTYKQNEKISSLAPLVHFLLGMISAPNWLD